MLSPEKITFSAFSQNAILQPPALHYGLFLCINLKNLLDKTHWVPSSSDVRVYDEWNKDWVNIVFTDIIKRWRKE